MSLNFKPGIEAAPLYVGGASVEMVQRQYGLDSITKMASNENALGPSPLAVEAIREAVSGLNRYPPMSDEDLRNALAEKIGLEPDYFVTGNGGCDLLTLIATGFLDPGDDCIICRPTFPVYEVTARKAGANIIYADLVEDFRYDVEAILADITDRTRLIYICSPNNPTGSIITADQMEKLVSHLPDHTLLVADEVYHHFATAEAYPDTLAYVRAGQNVAIIHSFSKAYGLAGLRLGYAIARPEIARYLSRARDPFHLSRPTLAGGIAALQDQAHIEETVSLTVSGRQRLYEAMTQLGIEVWPAQGNFLLFRAPNDPDEDSEQLLQQGFIVRPMANFYLSAYLRVTVGLPEENERFITALQTL